MENTVPVKFLGTIDVTKLVIDEQLELSRLLVKADYVIERQYKVKQKNGTTRSYINYGKRCENA